MYLTDIRAKCIGPISAGNPVQVKRNVCPLQTSGHDMAILEEETFTRVGGNNEITPSYREVGACWFNGGKNNRLGTIFRKEDVSILSRCLPLERARALLADVCFQYFLRLEMIAEHAISLHSVSTLRGRGILTGINLLRWQLVSRIK